jgi:preprotein translocase subunit YajC
MTGMFAAWMLLAEAAEGEAPRSPFGGLWPAMLAIMVLYFFLFLRPQRKQDANRRSQLDGLKKNDRVVTIGGIYGTVTNVQRESDEVTLKVDEATNAKLRVTFSSIARIITEDDAEGSTAAKT